MKSLPQNPTKSFRERNPHLYGTLGLGDSQFNKVVSEMATVAPPKPPKRIRQDTKPLMNELESEWFAQLQAFFPSRKFHAQTVRFKLGNGIWYKPDVCCMDFESNIVCWEIKGPFAHRGGFENLKVAASKYPEILWKLVWKQNGRWQEQMVLP